MHSANLHLRQPRLDDAGFIRELLNDPDWLHNIGDRGIHSDADAGRYIEERLLSAFRQHGFGLWVIEPREGGRALGLCGLVRRDFLDDVDIGFALLPAARGKGYALEAARRVLQLARQELRFKRLAGLTLPGNAPSIRILTQLGMGFERTLHVEGEAVSLYALRLE